MISSEFQKIARAHPNKNIIVSPFSAYMVLLMASYGARGNTENQMVKVLNRPEHAVIQKIFPRVLDLMKVCLFTFLHFLLLLLNLFL